MTIHRLYYGDDENQFGDLYIPNGDDIEYRRVESHV